VTLVHGTGDAYRTTDEVTARAEALNARGLRASVTTFEGGHHLDAGVLRAVAGA